LLVPIPKIIRAKWTRGVAQVVEHRLCKHKALSPNPVPPKKKKKEGGRKTPSFKLPENNITDNYPV
jgi:hypothetical protein